MNKRFLIGQYDSFNIKRHKREHRKGFRGVEACQFTQIEDIKEFESFMYLNNLSFGVHFPFRKGLWKYRDPQYLSQDNSIFKESYEYMEEEFQFIAQTNAEYVVIHYPKPVVLDRKVDWNRCWRFADETEYYFEDDYSFEEFKNRSRQFFEWINALSSKYSIRILIELDALNEYIYGTNLLNELLNEFKHVELCLDFGRLHLQHMIDRQFDAFRFIKLVGHNVKHVHLWNVKVANNVEGGHYPALAELCPEDGWADTKAYFNSLNQVSTDYTVLFEHNTSVIDDSQLQGCYEWIDQLVMYNK